MFLLKLTYVLWLPKIIGLNIILVTNIMEEGYYSDDIKIDKDEMSKEVEDTMSEADEE